MYPPTLTLTLILALILTLTLIQIVTLILILTLILTLILRGVHMELLPAILSNKSADDLSWLKAK